MVRKQMYAVIMAGGRGTRFWPRSRWRKPKHLLEIFSGKTILRETFERIIPLVPKDHVFVVTGRGEAMDVKRQLPEIPKEQILIEPVGRNTAPCIGLAALHIRRSNPEGVMMVLPSDHYIQKRNIFLSTLEVAGRIAEKENGLVTIGVKPNGPATGYGYVEMGEAINGFKNRSVYRVKSFREKPDLKTATVFIQSRRYLWNSGMFIWKASVILEAVKSYVPELYEGLNEIDKALGTRVEKNVIKKVYGRIAPVSIDNGVMEKSHDVVLVKGDFGWSDVGSWDALWELLAKDKKKNVTIGKTILVDSQRSFVYSPNKLIAMLDVEDLIVVDTKDCLLICRRSLSQNVRKIVEQLEKQGMNNYV